MQAFPRRRGIPCCDETGSVQGFSATILQIHSYDPLTMQGMPARRGRRIFFKSPHECNIHSIFPG